MTSCGKKEIENWEQKKKKNELRAMTHSPQAHGVVTKKDEPLGSPASPSSLLTTRLHCLPVMWGPGGLDFNLGAIRNVIVLNSIPPTFHVPQNLGT